MYLCKCTTSKRLVFVLLIRIFVGAGHPGGEAPNPRDGMQDASARIPCRADHWTSVLQRQLECVINTNISINISISINSNINVIKLTAPAPCSTTSTGIFWSSPIFCGPVWTGSTFETFDPSPHLNTILNVCDIDLRYCHFDIALQQSNMRSKWDCRCWNKNILQRWE